MRSRIYGGKCTVPKCGGEVWEVFAIRTSILPNKLAVAQSDGFQCDKCKKRYLISPKSLRQGVNFFRRIKKERPELSYDEWEVISGHLLELDRVDRVAKAQKELDRLRKKYAHQSALNSGVRNKRSRT